MLSITAKKPGRSARSLARSAAWSAVPTAHREPPAASSTLASRDTTAPWSRWSRVERISWRMTGSLAAGTPNSELAGIMWPAMQARQATGLSETVSEAASGEEVMKTLLDLVGDVESDRLDSRCRVHPA